MYKLATVVAHESASAYPELERNFDYIEKVIKTEEERFDETIDQGLDILKDYISESKEQGKSVLSGEQAFKLYDTYGFPIDLTKEILAENSMTVDEDGFKALMDEQRSRARTARGDMEDAAWEEDIFAVIEGNTEFDGYENNTLDCKVLGIGKNGALSDSAAKDDEIVLVLDRTCFYAESGGQIGDTGIIKGANGVVRVVDTKKRNGKFLHKCVVESGEISVGETVTAEIDYERRQAIRRNHSAVHLLQAALRNILGSHVAQAGSYVSEDRMRFDFSHFQAMTDEEIRKTEELVNQKILEDIPIDCFEMPLDEAKKMGAVAVSSLGIIYGMVMPMLVFPLTLAGSVTTLLVPEIARRNTLTDKSRLIGLVKRVYRAGAMAGIAVLVVFEIFAKPLTGFLYHDVSIAEWVRVLAWLCPVMFADSLSCAMLNGLGKQFSLLFYSISDSLIRLVLIFAFIPKIGMPALAGVIVISNLYTCALSVGGVVRGISGYKQKTVAVRRA